MSSNADRQGFKLWTEVGWLLTMLVIGAGVALTYFYFEAVVRNTITFIWDDVANTEQYRWIVPPLCIGLTLVYFGLQHVLDKPAETHTSHGLGEAPKATVVNFTKILLLGFFSLIAGASLGPEAVLVPACLVLGMCAGARLGGKSSSGAKMFAAAGFIALLAAFFHSFWVGLLAVLLVKKQFGTKISPRLLITAIAASGSAMFILNRLESDSYVDMPAYNWHLSLGSLLALLGLLAAGYGMTYALGFAHKASRSATKWLHKQRWWLHALVAGAGLSLLYLIGGSLVEFTGNTSVVPMLHQATDLGFIGLVWVLVVKLAAISWSQASGYRGGLVFPTIFAASVLVAIANLGHNDVNFIYGLLAVMVGALVADSKVKALL